MVFSTVGWFWYARRVHIQRKGLGYTCTEAVLFNWKNRPVCTLAEQWCSTVGLFTCLRCSHTKTRTWIDSYTLLDSSPSWCSTSVHCWIEASTTVTLSLSWCSSIGRIDWCTLLDWGKYNCYLIILLCMALASPLTFTLAFSVCTRRMMVFYCWLVLIRSVFTYEDKDLDTPAWLHHWAGALQLEESTCRTMVLYSWLIHIRLRRQGLGWIHRYEDKDLDGYTCLIRHRAGALQLEESTGTHIVAGVL